MWSCELYGVRGVRTCHRWQVRRNAQICDFCCCGGSFSALKQWNVVSDILNRSDKNHLITPDICDMSTRQCSISRAVQTATEVCRWSCLYAGGAHLPRHWQCYIQCQLRSLTYRPTASAVYELRNIVKLNDSALLNGGDTERITIGLQIPVTNWRNVV